MFKGAKILILPLLLWPLFPSKGDTGAREIKVQFFGDVYLPKHVLKATGSTSAHPRVFSESSFVLKRADWNIVNFEGATTDLDATAAAEEKEHILQMPLWTPALLRAAGIQGVTLANNHSMDFGSSVLLNMIDIFKQEGMMVGGAGRNLAEAIQPMVLPTSAGIICVLSFSRTLPESFWAKEAKAGTASLDFGSTAQTIRSCSERYSITFVTFHWGSELSPEPKEYQRQLAHLAIDSGATAVIGHHPHVLQDIEIYKNRPIFYSLGNFAFGTKPYHSIQEGLAVNFLLGLKEELSFELTPMMVANEKVEYIPRPLLRGEKDPIAHRLPKEAQCRWQKEKRHWSCRLPSRPRISLLPRSE